MQAIESQPALDVSNGHFGKISIFPNPRAEQSNVKAFAHVHYSGIMFYGLRVIEGRNGLFVSPPSEKVNDKWQNPYYFADRVLRDRFNEVVLGEFRKPKGEQPETEVPQPAVEEPAREMAVDDIPF